MIKTFIIEALTFCFRNEQEFFEIYDEIFGQGEYWFDPRVESPLIVDCGCHIGISVL